MLTVDTLCYWSHQYLYCPPLNRDPVQVLSQWEWNEWDASTEGN